MKTYLRMLLGLIASIAVAIVIAIAAFGLLRDMSAESSRIDTFGEVAQKARALQVLTASFREDSARSDIQQAQRLLSSLDDVLKTLVSRQAREQVLIEQLARGRRDLGPLIDQWFTSGLAPDHLNEERREILAAQIRMKVQFLSDDTRRLIAISQARLADAKRDTGTIIVVLIVVLALTNGTIFLLSVRSLLRTQSELNRAAGFNETVLKSLGEGVYTLDAMGRVTSMNPAAEQLFGWTLAELRGRKMHDVTHHHSREGQTLALAECPEHQVLIDGQPLHNCDDVFIRKDGTYFDVVYSVAPLRDASRTINGLVVVFQDITDQKRSREAVRDSEARYRALIQVAVYGIITIDSQGTIESVNPAAERLFGYRGEEMIGRNISMLMPEPYQQEHDSYLENYRRTGVRKIIGIGREVVGLRRDGTQFPMDLGVNEFQIGPKRYFQGMVSDISERKRSEQALRESESRLRSVIDQLPAGVGLMDTRGNWIISNANLERYVPKAIPSTLPDRIHLWRFVTPQGEVIPPEKWPGQRALRGETIVPGIEALYSLEDGTEIWMRVSAAPLRNESGDVVGATAVVQDITDRKQAEQALREADRRKDEFLATLAHELRNPLAPLRNALEILRRANGDEPLIEQARTLMERQVSHLVRLVDDLLDVSRITQGKLLLRKEPVDLTDVLQNAIETSRPLIDASDHQLTVSIPSESIQVLADPTRLAQVFANLLNNAAKYTEKGGHIWLTVEPKGEQVAISVRDTGMGIPPEHLHDIFNMFSQIAPVLERSQGGLGIGLSLVKGIMDLHGGSITVHSGGPGKGSEFLVHLPIVIKSQPSTPQVNRDDGSAHSQKFRILVVDDLRDAADSMAMMLQLMGHETRTAYDGLEALQTAATFQPHIVLLDIGLPKMNGYETASRIRNETWGGNVALVALTGWGQEDDKRRSLEAGFDHHLTKPVDIPALRNLLAALLSTSSPSLRP